MLMVYTFFKIIRGINGIKEQMNTNMTDKIFTGVMKLASQSIQFRYGWVLLIAGSTLICIAAVIKNKRHAQVIGSPLVG